MTKEVRLLNYNIKKGQVVQIDDKIEQFITHSIDLLRGHKNVKVVVDSIEKHQFDGDINPKWHNTIKYSFHVLEHPKIRGWFWDHEIAIV